MTLQLLISTIDQGINRLRGSLLPPRSDVSYLISWQYTGERPAVPDWIDQRPDVEVTLLEGRGLSRNRNHALLHAKADVVKICDDDEQWTDEDLDNILSAYERHPEADIIHFMARGLEKQYPPQYVSSVELTMRRARTGQLRFDERFGLGSPFLASGEEEVLLCDARRAGLVVRYEPCYVCETHGPSTGSRCLAPRVLRSKGAMFCYTRGVCYALCKSLRESMGHMIRHHASPFFVFRHMLWGIKYIRSCHR